MSPLYGKILAWFVLNLAVLALLFFFFLKAQFRLGLDWMLAGEPGDRIAAMGDRLTQEFSRASESQWTEKLRVLGAARGRDTGGSGLGLAITKRCIEA